MSKRSVTILTLLISSALTLASTFADAATYTGGASYYRARTRLGCAHRFLPFGTRVLVTNLRNGHHLVLTVNDRGPFVRGRIIDVSTQAASMLGFRRAGVVPVRVETLSRTAATDNWGRASFRRLGLASAHHWRSANEADWASADKWQARAPRDSNWQESTWRDSDSDRPLTWDRAAY